MTPAEQAAERQAVAEGNEASFRRLFEKCARRFHEFARTQGAEQHRLWHFDSCPAESCRSARKSLGMRVDFIPAAIGKAREPGEEG